MVEKAVGDRRAKTSSHSESSDDLLEEGSEGGVPEGRTLPLSSSRLTLANLRRIADSLGLPGRGTKADLLAAIEAELSQMREPQNVQVIIQEREAGVQLYLIDEQGVFLEVEPGQKEPSRLNIREPALLSTDETDHLIEDLRQENDGLKGALEDARRQGEEQGATIRQLEQEVERLSNGGEVGTLRSELKKEKDRAKKLWALNCKRATEQEALLVAKDLEIEELKARLKQTNRAIEDSSEEGVAPTPQLILLTPQPDL